jgi:hypothetical protein
MLEIGNALSRGLALRVGRRALLHLIRASGVSRHLKVVGHSDVLKEEISRLKDEFSVAREDLEIREMKARQTFSEIAVQIKDIRSQRLIEKKDLSQVRKLFKAWRVSAATRRRLVCLSRSVQGLFVRKLLRVAVAVNRKTWKFLLRQLPCPGWKKVGGRGRRKLRF